MGAGKGDPLTRESLSDFGLVDAGTLTWFGTRDLGFCCNGKRALAPATEKSEYWEKGTPDTRHLRGRGTKALHPEFQYEAEEFKTGRSLKSVRPVSFLCRPISAGRTRPPSDPWPIDFVPHEVRRRIRRDARRPRAPPWTRPDRHLHRGSTVPESRGSRHPCSPFPLPRIGRSRHRDRILVPGSPSSPSSTRLRSKLIEVGPSRNRQGSPPRRFSESTPRRSVPASFHRHRKVQTRPVDRPDSADAPQAGTGGEVPRASAPLFVAQTRRLRSQRRPVRS